MTEFNTSDCWTPHIHRQMVKETSQELWRYIQKNARVAEAEDVFLTLSRISEQDLRSLSQIHFLLSEEVEHLATEIAPAILNRLSKTSHSEMKTTRGAVRGRVQWSKTYTTRAATGDSSLFVTHLRSSIFDLPENQVFLFLMKQISHLAKKITDTEWDDESDFEEELKSHKWMDRVSSHGKQCLKWLRNPFVTQITEVPTLTERMLEQTEKARGSGYTRLARVARQYMQCQQQPLVYLESQRRGRVLEPLNRDKLFELAVLFKILTFAQNKGWMERQASLIGGGEGVVSLCSKNHSTLTIYYQGIPEAFEKNSRYKELMQNHGLRNRMRQPDIVLQWSHAEEETFRYCIVEVKRSDKRDYLVDGAYKVFGYLKDFENAWNPQNRAQALLVGWAGISPHPTTAQQDVYLTAWSDLETTLESVFPE